MKYITFDDIKKLNIEPYTCYEWVSQMIKDKNLAKLPPKISMALGEGEFCNVMPCVIPDKELGYVGGVKVVNRYPDRKPSLDSELMFLNMTTGEFLALMDANWITAMRTGAVAAHSIERLAKKDFSTIAILGLGNTARAALLVLESIFKDRDFTVKLLKYKGQEIDFAKRFEKYSNLHFYYIDTPEELVKGSEVVISCVTYSGKDFCRDECFDEGVLVVPVHTRGFTNCDLFFDKIYADDYGHVCHFKNFDKFRKFGEMTDVVNGRIAGRENNKERILAYNIGVSIHDINFAANIYRMIKDKKGLVDVDMHVPKEKFWI